MSSRRQLTMTTRAKHTSGRHRVRGDHDRAPARTDPRARAGAADLLGDVPARGRAVMVPLAARLLVPVRARGGVGGGVAA